VAPTLIQESGSAGRPARPIEEKRQELAEAGSLGAVLSEQELAELRRIGDNSGSMALKGASLEHEGEPRADRWPLSEELRALADRWSIAPERELVKLG
jgi:hypothetical protein